MEDPIEIKYWLEDPTSEAAINECKRVRLFAIPMPSVEPLITVSHYHLVILLKNVSFAD
jgi:hypothetical protein